MAISWPFHVRTLPSRTWLPSSLASIPHLGCAPSRVTKDGSGYITKKAFLHVMTCLGDRFEVKEVESMMAELKCSEDGLVSYRDFITWALER